MKRICMYLVLFFVFIGSGFSLTNISDCSGGTFVANTQGETYEIIGNLPTTNTCISVAADDIVIDCKGYNLTGDYSLKDFGINITRTDNVTVKNCNIYNFDMTILAYLNTNLKIENNYLYDANNRANILWSGNNNTVVINNTFENPSENAGTFYPVSHAGIGLTNYDSYNVLFENNTILHTNYDGIWIEDDYNWTYRGNYFFNTTYSIYVAYNSLVVDNIFNYSSYPDAFIYSSQPGSRIINNTFINNSDKAFGGYSGDAYYIEGNDFININAIFNRLNDQHITFGSGNTYTNVNYIMYDTNAATFYINESMTLPAGNYILNDTDLDGAIIIDSDNVNLDCNGANINGSWVGIGIKFTNKDNIVVENCNLNTYDTMLEMDGGINALVQNNSFFDSDNEDIAMNGINNSRIINNFFDNPSASGAIIYEISGAKPENYFNLFDGNTITNTNYDGVYMMQDYNWTFTNNNFFNSSYSFYACPNCLIQDNVFDYSGDNYEIIYESDSGSKIIDNTFINFTGGRVFNHFTNDEFYFQGNQFTDIDIMFDKVDNVLLNFISANLLTRVNYVVNDPTLATMIVNTDSILPKGNFLMYDTDLDGAIRINKSDITLDCNGATIFGNGVGSGIYITQNVGGVTIKNCNIENFASAISIDGDGQGTPHMIFNNYFNASVPITFLNSVNFNNWNDSSNGNYWTNSSGAGFSETCTNRGDGICNTSYTLGASNLDYLALTTTPVIPDEVIPVESSNASISSEIGYVSPVSTGISKITKNTFLVNVTFGSESVSNCILNIDNGTTISMTSGASYCYGSMTINYTDITTFSYYVSYDLDSSNYALTTRYIKYYPLAEILLLQSSVFPVFGLGSLIFLFLSLLFIL